MMEREVSDTEGVFSRRMSSNWAELPNTLRRRQKHRPEILSQFTDFSESSECEYRRQETPITRHVSSPFGQPYRHVLKRSELVRKFENHEDRGDFWDRSSRFDKKSAAIGCINDDYRKNYEFNNNNNNNNNNNQKNNNNVKSDKSKLMDKLRGRSSRKAETERSIDHRYDRDYPSFSDDERKTNSPDSLLVKSSESESSSDEYGHTDDSGAFLERAHNNDRIPRTKYEMFNGTRITDQNRVLQKSRFAKFFSSPKDDPEMKRSRENDENGKTSRDGKFDMNKNVRKIVNDLAKTRKPNDRSEDDNLLKDKFIESGPPRYEYENIPRIDFSKIDHRSFQNSSNASPKSSSEQPTIEQLRMEAGCQLRNTRNSTNDPVKNSRDSSNREDSSKKIGTCSSPVSAMSFSSSSSPSSFSSTTENRTNRQASIEQLRLEGLIQDFYNNDQINSSNRSNDERKLSKMETITEEKQDGNKLSVREILKRFEELRMQNEMQNDERQNDKTLNTIQETLKKLDEKVKSYQIDQKPIHKSNHHENHVTQITKSIQSHANHSVGGHQHGLHNQSSHNQSNHVTGNVGNHEVHSAGNRGSGQHGINAIGQTSPPANQHKNQRNLSPSQHHANNQVQHEWRQPEETIKNQEESFYESGPVVNDGKHSLLQYAMLNFRQSTEKFEMMKTADGSISGSLKVIESLKSKKKNKKSKGQQDGAEWTWKEQVDLVKYSQIPIEQSLLRLDGELSLLAVECFMCLMRYMGDQPLPPDMSEVKCVYTILMHCHKFEPLRDEVYCQLMKQTTNNKSPNPESCQRGWRLFSIVAAYFTCSEGLRAYLIKYLETAAYDKRRAYHGTATVCLQNLRKTVKYGGRKNVPSVEEIMAISAGRNAKRQIYRLPGGTERVINTKCTTVVQDVIEEMCSVISVRNPHEMDEFSLYCIVDGDAFTMPLARDEYVLDVTTELHKNHQVFYLIFCRSVWYYPLRLDAALYIEVVFNQIAPDYLEGLLLVLPGEHLPQEIIYDMAQIAALLHRAADMAHEPTTKEIKYLLPKPALSLREPRPQQWGNMVQQAWNNIQHNTAAVCKAQVLEILSKWPLFGSSFFAVKRVPENGKEKVGDHILALNRHGVDFIDLITHETLYHYPYSEVISTRKVKSEEGTLYLDMKCGNLMQQRITRLQTEQAHEISRLIRQYITMEQRTTNNQPLPISFAMR